MPYTETGKTWKKLALISEHAKGDPNVQFISLAHLLNKEFLEDCYNSLNKNKAVGIDDVTWASYGGDLEGNLDNLITRLKRKSYKPLPAKRVYIPKNEKEKRPLGLPALENKIVEKGIKLILESIYEQDFLNCSYGFRPRKSCHHALKEVNDLIMARPVNHVIEVDITKFFDTVSHEDLMNFIRIRIKDTSMLILIEKFLKAGYIDGDLFVRTDEGTPQGSILSPLLANIYLHYVLDEWFEKMVKPNVDGFCAMVRYADDFICVTQKVETAKKIEEVLKKRLNKYGLETHPTKSRRLSFGRYEKENADSQNRPPNTFDFLGFTHYCGKTRKGKFKIGRKTSRKKYVAKCKAMNTWLKQIRNKEKTKEWWKTLRLKLNGHYQYYGVSDNYKELESYYKMTIRALRKWLNRRSQKRKMSWEKFNNYLTHYPLPTPRIRHSFYTLSV